MKQGQFSLRRLVAHVGVVLMLAPAWADPPPIRIGMVNAQSGPAAELGQAMRVGAQAVFDEINERGGVHGRRLQLSVADDAYEPEQTVEQTLHLIHDEQVLALFGYVGTPTTQAVLPLLAELEVPLVGVFSGARSLRQPVQRQVFHVRASYDQETEALVARLQQAGARKVAVVYQNDGFGLAVLAGTERALQRRGATVQAAGSFQRNTLALRMALAAMLEAQPDAVVLAGPYTPVAAFIAQARAAGLKTQFATVSFVGTESLLERLGADAPGVLVSQVVPHPGRSDLAIVRECRQTLQRRVNATLGYLAFESCINARLMVLALEQAGPQPTRERLRAALESMRQLDLGGLQLSLSAGDHQASHQVYMTRLEGGRIVALD